MSGRVSIKGKGADIFFDEKAGSGADIQRDRPSTKDNEDAAPSDRSQSAESKPASQLARQPASLPASQQDSMQAPSRIPREIELSESTRRRLRDLLDREHRTHNTYRYHKDELSAVRDIVYEFEVRWGTKVSKNDVMRAVLLWAIDDYAERGEKSILIELLREEVRP